MINQLSGGYIGSSFGYYYNQLSIEQKQKVNNILGRLGVSISEVEFYFGFISKSLGNVSFFVFVFLLKKNPNLINKLRAQAAGMGFGAAGAAGAAGIGFGAAGAAGIGFGAAGAAGAFGLGVTTSTPSIPPTPTPTPIPTPTSTPTPTPSIPPTPSTPSTSSSIRSTSSDSSPTTPASVNPTPRQIGDAFLTHFSPKDLENLKNGGSLDLKNGVIANFKELAKYDKNGDGKIDGQELKDLQVAIDFNKDGIIDKNEIKTALDANVKEIDLKAERIITNDERNFGVKEDPKVKIGNEDKAALIIDSNKDEKPTKDANNRLEPGDFGQFGAKPSDKPSDNTPSANSDANRPSANETSSSADAGSSGSAGGNTSSGGSS
jgi:hypothetical protein